MQLVREWGGDERRFELRFGHVLDLEDACGKVGVGAIFLRASTGQWSAREVFETIRLALIGGGMDSMEARALVKRKFDEAPYMVHAAIASEILLTLMSGVEPAGDDAGDGNPAEPMRLGSFAEICAELGMSPEELRATRYADFLNIVRGLAAGRKRTVDPPSEEVFLKMIENSKA